MVLASAARRAVLMAVQRWCAAHGRAGSHATVPRRQLRLRAGLVEAVDDVGQRQLGGGDGEDESAEGTARAGDEARLGERVQRLGEVVRRRSGRAGDLVGAHRPIVLRLSEDENGAKCVVRGCRQHGRPRRKTLFSSGYENRVFREVRPSGGTRNVWGGITDEARGRSPTRRAGIPDAGSAGCSLLYNEGTRIWNGDHAGRAGSLGQTSGFYRRGPLTAGHYRRSFRRGGAESFFAPWQNSSASRRSAVFLAESAESAEHSSPGSSSRTSAPFLSIHNPKWF